MSKKLKAKDLRLKTRKDLLLEMNLISRELMKLKLVQDEENNKHHIFGVMKKNISRILTILSEKNE